MNSEIIKFYSTGVEKNRLFNEFFQLERVRTQQIISRYLNKTNLTILDIGGATGFYSFWLSSLDNEVHLVDITPYNIEEAKKCNEINPYKLAKITLADARKLPYEDQTFDIVLLFGPLYHLQELEERLSALREAKRVMKDNGLIFCAAISRFTSLINLFFQAYYKDPRFIDIVKNDLNDGKHNNMTENLLYFTTTYFHKPEDLEQEIKNSGLNLINIIPVESFGWMIPEFDNIWKLPEVKKLLLELIKSIEDEPSIKAMTAHFLAIAKK